MKKNLILSVVLWQIWIATGLAQPGWVLHGVVMDRESRQPLPGAVVAVDALGLGVFAGPEGQFSLTVNGADSVLLSLEMLGYRKKLIPLKLADKPSGPLELGRIGLEPVPLKAEEVNVVGRREELKDALRSVTVLEDEALFRNQGQTLGDLLRDLPGVSILQTGPSIAKPVIRGVHSDRILIVNAGVHMEGQQWGDEHAPAIDPFAQARVEVLRGAAGVEYGAGAIG
ncbi:MAG TPA: TonB-dependent receptor plug domain-containing protein, partial [Calditrichia bacterium]|nr:TonB-dependent receptor plug domain-containing protein [Calditrichia bacterium]